MATVRVQPRSRYARGTVSRWLLAFALTITLVACDERAGGGADSDSDPQVGRRGAPWLLAEPISPSVGDTVEIEGDGWRASGEIALRLVPADDGPLGVALREGRYLEIADVSGPAFTVDISIEAVVRLHNGSSYETGGAGLMVVASQAGTTIGQRIDVEVSGAATSRP